MARTRIPRTRGLDVYLAGRVRVAKKFSGQNRDRVLLVVDVRHVPVERYVDVIRESVVAHAR